MHFYDNYIYGKCTDYIWEYGEIGENNTYLCTDHVPQVYIPCWIPCSSLVQYSLNCSLITRYSKTQLQESATSYQRYTCVPALLLPQFCCYTSWSKHRKSIKCPSRSDGNYVQNSCFIIVTTDGSIFRPVLNVVENLKFKLEV